MPKKDTAAAVLGMLSTVGAQTRPPAPEILETVTEPPEPVAEPEPTPAAVEPVADVRPTASVRQLPPAPTKNKGEEAPRTLRLQPGTASDLRAAWLEAKRDDVLLTAQDFASALVDEALAARRRRTRAAGTR